MNTQERWMALSILPAVLLVGLGRAPAGDRQTSKAGRPPISPAAQGYVYTANEAGNSVSVIDLRTGAVRSVPVPISPHNVQISRDGTLLLALGAPAARSMPSAAGPGQKMTDMETMPGRLLLLGAAGPRLRQIAGVEVGRHSAHVVVDASTRLAYATSSGENAVFVVDLGRRKTVRRIATGAFPHGLRLSPDGRQAYVACANSNNVSVIDVARSREIARIPVGKAPVQVGFTPDGRRCYVSLRDENAVAVVDTRTRRGIAKVPVGRSPIQVFATPNGRWVYVANQGTQARPDNTASVIDTRTNRVAATLKTGKGCHGVVVSDDGRYAFTANSFENTVSVIDTAAQRVLRNIAVGAQPGGITFRRGESRG